jgi:hypothetical protein
MKLIAMLVICQFFSHVIIIVPYLSVVIPLKTMSLVVCFFTECFPVAFICDMLVPTTVAISVDRLLSIFVPIWSSKNLYI